MKLAVIFCAAIATLPVAAAAEVTHTAAEWVAQLGAQSLADRDAASDALLSLGAKARGDVHSALNSSDPEVQSRAKELWKTLRWLVVPDADEDIKSMVAEAGKGAIAPSHWKTFVQKYGAESIRLVAEFRAEANPSKPQQGAIYEAGLREVLDDAPPVDVARIISQTSQANGRDGLEALLDEGVINSASPQNIPEKTAAHWMQIEIALWNYEKAYNFGCDYAFRTGSYQAMKQCAIAADRGLHFDKIHEAADKDIAAETDPARLCAKLSFYTGLFTQLEKKSLIDPLFDLSQNTGTAHADDSSLRRLVEILLNAGMPGRAVKVLHNVQSPLTLYMRSVADMQIEDEPVAGADWHDAMAALEAVEDGKKKEAFYNMAEVMNDWHDARAELLWQKILSIPPVITVYDANACFRIGQLMEARNEYSQAADIYEKGLQISGSVSGFLVVTGPQGAVSGEKVMREKIKNLRALAAGRKTIFDGSSTPDDKGKTDPSQNGDMPNESNPR